MPRVLKTEQGGLGTNTSPTTGQVALGTSSGDYTPTTFNLTNVNDVTITGMGLMQLLKRTA